MCEEKYRNINYVVYLLDQNLEKSCLRDGCICILNGDDTTLKRICSIFESFLNSTFGDEKC